MNLQCYNLPDHWACALINGDTSGMSDADEAALDGWFTDTFPYGAHCLNASPEEEGPGFMRWHDAVDWALACNCLTYTFDVNKEPIDA